MKGKAGIKKMRGNEYREGSNEGLSSDEEKFQHCVCLFERLVKVSESTIRSTAMKHRS